MSWTAYNGREYSSGSIVSGESSFAHTGSIVYYKSGYVFVAHFDWLNLQTNTSISIINVTVCFLICYYYQFEKKTVNVMKACYPSSPSKGMSRWVFLNYYDLFFIPHKMWTLAISLLLWISISENTSGSLNITKFSVCESCIIIKFNSRWSKPRSIEKSFNF